jgi:hypothetical protein
MPRRPTRPTIAVRSFLHSTTDGGKTWVITPATLQAKTTVTGLTPGATVEFRYRSVTKTGEGNWSQTQLIVK